MRILERLDELYAIGRGPGANRPHGSAEEDAAHVLAAAWMEEAGLSVEVDTDGNLLGRASNAGQRLQQTVASEVWVGSHLDTVPQGGRFDGALGVVAGIDAVERSGRGTVVAFRGEEVGCIGSRALVAGGGPLPAVFLELHVEQGPVLEAAGASLGVVTAIVGYARGELVFEGRAGHAGTTPMSGRQDALVAAAEGILGIRDAAAAIDGAVATVGQVDVEPGGSNVIPDRVRISVDARAPDMERLERLVAAIGVEPATWTEPAAMAEEPRRILREEIERLGLPVVELPSGAGHDAGILAAAGVASSILFVRSLNGGISHSPEELSSEGDIELAVEVLTATLARIEGEASLAPTTP
jgi:acetylornithine deacetylase/succinyl-diaminopimelate desuccinylase-like protein